MENKYKDGEEVYAKVNPSLKLIVRRSWDSVYYCKIKEDITQKELIYFEKELMSDQA